MLDHHAISKARMAYYGLFASAFAFNFTEREYEVIRKNINLLLTHPFNELSGVVLYEMQKISAVERFEGLKQESDQIFFSPTTTMLPTTASYYFEKRDDGSQRVMMIDYILQSNFRKNADEFKENEDHIEFILLFIQRLIEDELNGNKEAGRLAKDVFANILDGMVDQFCDNVFNHENARFYKHTVTLFNAFMEIERQYLEIEQQSRVNVKDMTRPGVRKGKLPPRQMQKRNFEEFGSI